MTTVNHISHIFNHKKDRSDNRDLKFEVFHKPSVVPNPVSVDLRTTTFAPSVLDQGQLGSCTANACSNALKFLLKKQKLSVWQPSRLYIYWFSRFLEGTTNEDSGCQIRDVMTAIHTYGACDEKLLPYNINRFKTRPSNSCVRSATPHIKNFKYLSVSNNETSLKNCLAAGFPIVFGFDVYESFETQAVATTGIVPMPDTSKEELLGGHCVCIYGYDDVKKQYLVMNSWGAGWGQKGFFYAPYDFIKLYGSDFWTLRFFE
jgi:C1A family cysteine protease